MWVARNQGNQEWCFAVSWAFPPSGQATTRVSKRNTFSRIPLSVSPVSPQYSETVPFLYIYQLTYFISSKKSWYILILQNITLLVNLVSSTYFKIRRKKCTNTKTQKQTPNCVGIASNECVCFVEEKNNPDGMFILQAFFLKERTDYASETFTVMGHNSWKQLDRLADCPWTTSLFYLYPYSFGNFIHSLVLKYYLYVATWNTPLNLRPVNSPAIWRLYLDIY